ncbi:kinase-like domain-containing protein [Dunaliella salina]|uniref:Kinase-like domain-containing protein n=1 Tax=Dunaliella salina TaxID=3046 RepID=A0ABQ7G9P0_DUNSA|nr:kinase-like domain-containing protein [Dunaliella salina]|eukprot:KAF5831320.1 kinase-like domain-containing protein [Dunaliella salina]
MIVSSVAHLLSSLLLGNQEKQEEGQVKSTDKAAATASSKQGERKGAAKGEAALIKSKDGSMILAKPDAVEVVVSEGPTAPDGQNPATERISSTSDGLKSLSSNEADNVQDTLMKVSMLVQRFGEGRTERTTAIQALRKALDLISQDAQASFASVHVLPEALDSALMVALVGAPSEYVENNRLLQFGNSGRAVEIVVSQQKDYLGWHARSNTPAPSDWQQLHDQSGLMMLSAVPIKVSGTYLGLLTLGFKDTNKEKTGLSLWSAYMQLVAASLSSMVKDNGIQKHLALVKEVQLVPNLDALLHLLVESIRSMLGHQSNDHTWYKVALAANNSMAATVFDDLSQVPAPLMLRAPAATNNSSHSASILREVQAAGYVSSDIFNTRIIKPPTSVVVFPLKGEGQEVFGVVYCLSCINSNFSDISPKLREICEVLSPHVLNALTHKVAEDYEEVLFAQAGEGGSSHSLCQVTGITEKLNQKRTKSSMDFVENHGLGALQITHVLGEGGFAKVFCGLWRGLIVGVKVVCDDGENEKNVIKNAHEIAILRAISHPNIVQAFTCMTDVPVADLLRVCMVQAQPALFNSQVYQYLKSMDTKMCHIEVIDYCDVGNMGTALRNHIFQVPRADKMLATVAAAARNGLGSDGWLTEPSGNVYMHRLLLTLVEIASAMAYLHHMGIVHCDIKPGNVLLRSSHLDPRGFTTKLSDFGLSRVEDDEQASFPFNSCGTASYVAPEALICNRKVTSSVDVYAFGILLWEMYTGARPYGSMKQQQIVEEVVMRGLRPRFPPGTPRGYAELAQACWSGAATSRPSFEEVERSNRSGSARSGGGRPSNLGHHYPQHAMQQQRSASNVSEESKRSADKDRSLSRQSRSGIHREPSRQAQEC